ncbi:MAG: PorV/PorQ family protein [Bacteroidetes bacterium]|nr:PorV/PorQ family protein [Bacteroidota bacterium]
MKKLSIRITAALLPVVVATSGIFAGNVQRAGQAGAGELLINPWARSSGWAEANTASIRGLEAIYLNVAGTAFTRKTELIFSHSQWLVGSGIGAYNFGFSQKVGEAGVMSLVVNAMDFGSIDITTTDNPDGGLGTYRPQYTTISAAFAKEFSNSIYGGATFKVINEGIADVKATGVAIDAGIQYVTGFGKDKAGNKIRDNLKFGISMKNVGPEMKYSGDGISFRGESPSGIIMTNEYRMDKFELPSLIKIGFSYDLRIMQQVDTTKDEVTSDHRITFAGNFTSNSFTRDQFHFGLEYGFKEMVMIRAGYLYEDGIMSDDERRTVFTGPTAGVSVEIPINKENGSTFAIDYSYRATNPFNGVHTIGVKVSL